MISLGIRSLLTNKQVVLFVVVNVLVAFLGFVRSFVFMKFLNFEELGLLTLLQTGAMFIGFFQIGLVNGGYRLIALRKENVAEKTNNVIFSYLGVSFLFFISIYLINYFLNILADHLFLFVLLIYGLSLLVFNWLTNILIAERKYAQLNKINLVSAMMSIFCLPMANYWGAYGGAISLLIQPLVFSLYILIFSKKFRPTRFLLNIDDLKEILNYGFVPYISGIFFLLYTQIERLTITFFLGTSALGNMYLFILVSAVWVLVPVSIMNLFFPKCVIFFEKKNYLELNKLVKNHFYIVLFYCSITVVFLIFYLKSLIGNIFPEHLSYINLVYVGIPGLVFRTLSDPMAVFFNSVTKLKPILWSDITSIILYLSLIFILFLKNWFSLTNVIVVFNLYFIFKFIYLLICYLKFKKVYL